MTWMIWPGRLRRRSATSLERSDQTYLNLRPYGSGPQFKVYQRARRMIARYVRRAIEIDRKARPWLDAT